MMDMIWLMSCEIWITKAKLAGGNWLKWYLFGHEAGLQSPAGEKSEAGKWSSNKGKLAEQGSGAGPTRPWSALDNRPEDRGFLAGILLIPNDWWGYRDRWQAKAGKHWKTLRTTGGQERKGKNKTKKTENWKVSWWLQVRQSYQLFLIEFIPQICILSIFGIISKFSGILVI